MRVIAFGLEHIFMSLLNEAEPLFTANIHDIQRPSSTNELSLLSPAMDVFTDFTQQHPLMIEQNTSIDEAREIMRRTHTKMFLVIDAQESFRGVISLDDLESEKVIKEMGRSKLRRKELTVEFVMTPRNRLRAIDFRKFELSTIGDILARMKKYGEHHVVVVEPQNSSVRGIVSAYGIARRMHAPIVISERALLFSDIYKAVAVSK
jgi:DeoR family transcriptional regulator, catabolite repression regulator